MSTHFQHRGQPAKLSHRTEATELQRRITFSLFPFVLHVCALIKERRGSKHVKAILSDCFHTPVHILPQRKLDIDTTVEQKQCLSNQSDLPNLTEQSQHELTRQSRKGFCKKNLITVLLCFVGDEQNAVGVLRQLRSR